MVVIITVIILFLDYSPRNYYRKERRQDRVHDYEPRCSQRNSN